MTTDFFIRAFLKVCFCSLSALPAFSTRFFAQKLRIMPLTNFSGGRDAALLRPRRRAQRQATQRMT
jgi:hypothetical protein